MVLRLPLSHALTPLSIAPSRLKYRTGIHKSGGSGSSDGVKQCLLLIISLSHPLSLQFIAGQPWVLSRQESRRLVCAALGRKLVRCRRWDFFLFIFPTAANQGERRCLCLRRLRRVETPQARYDGRSHLPCLVRETQQQSAMMIEAAYRRGRC